jgi:hypothetical protein
VDGASPFSVTFLSRDDFSLEDEGKYLTEKQGLSVRDFEDTYPAATQSGAWTVLYK